MVPNTPSTLTPLPTGCYSNIRRVIPVLLMEFADLIRVSRVDNVRLRRPEEAGRGCEGTVGVTGHHLIISLETEADTDTEREIWLLHRLLLGVTRESEASARSGTLTLRYKDLRILHLDIIGSDKLASLQLTLEDLIKADNPSSSYPFFYNPGLFKALEDGWHLFRPEQEFLSLVGQNTAEWRLR